MPWFGASLNHDVAITLKLATSNSFKMQKNKTLKETEYMSGVNSNQQAKKSNKKL